MAKGTKIELNEQALCWLIKHFKHKKNTEIVAHLGISESTLHRIVRKLGLKKTPQFMRKCQAEASAAAKESHLRNDTYPPKGFVIPNREAGMFQKGVTPLQRLGKRMNAERIRKSAESREKTRKSERARATFGLPQRTKLRVIPVPMAKVKLRWYLPTQSLLQRWLREERNIHITVDVANGWKIEHTRGLPLKDHNDEIVMAIRSSDFRWEDNCGCFDSFEECLEDALKYALENLV